MGPCGIQKTNSNYYYYLYLWYNNITDYIIIIICLVVLPFCLTVSFPVSSTRCFPSVVCRLPELMRHPPRISTEPRTASCLWCKVWLSSVQTAAGNELRLFSLLLNPLWCVTTVTVLTWRQQIGSVTGGL